MRLYILCFAAGVWCLQVQAQLPVPRTYWLVPPLAVLALLLWAPRPLVPRVARRTLAALCCAFCGFVWAAWFAQYRLADALPAEWEGRDIQLSGVVATMPQPYERSVRFEFDVEQILTANARAPARIVLSWWGSAARDDKPATLPAIRAGERWRLTVRLRQPHGTLNPHGFDYEAWLLERNIRATGYIRPAGYQRTAQFVPRPQYAVERVREAVRSRIQSALAGAPYAGVLSALAIGDQRAIAQEQWQVFTRTGVNHLMSISGLHVTMIAGLAGALVYWLWRR